MADAEVLCHPGTTVADTEVASHGTTVAEADVDSHGTSNRSMEQIRTELEKELARPAERGDLGLLASMAAQTDMHMSILESILNLHTQSRGQQPRRQLEQVVRLRAVQCSSQRTDLGYTLAEAAQRLGLHERTLRHWTGLNKPALILPPSSVISVPPLGRRPTLADPEQRQAVISWLSSAGPGVSVASLRDQFAAMPRVELDGLLKAYRACWRAAHPRLLHVLHWQKPGTTWAMDFAEAPCLIDGKYPYLLAVRDLASGQQLLWQPVAHLTAEVVQAELAVLFALHGAPWVLKTDNGSAFIADALRWYLQRCGVLQLFSPPLTPMYNGSIEASIGSLKTRTQRQSESAGHAGAWTSMDVASAQAEANTTARPRKLHGKTPDQVWDARRQLSMAEHVLFQATVEKFRREERTNRDLPADEPLTRTEQAAVDRVALRRALVAHDLLLFRRRRIPPQIKRPKMATKR